MSGRGADWAIACGLAAAVALTYAPVRHHEFVNFDDPEYVVDNRHVTGGLSIDAVVWAFRAVHSANWHPLTWLSHMLDCELFGLDPGAHHVTSAVLHGVATLLLFGALRSMTGARWRSAIVAALFALHPRNVESVAWVSERKDVLSAVFWTATMWAYAAYAKRPGPLRYVAVLVLFGLGLLSKPMLVTLPAALLLLDVWPLGRTAIAPPADGRRVAARPLRELVVEKLPLFVLSAAASVVTFEAQRRSGAMTTLETLPIAVRVENALVAYATYLAKTVWPAGLAAFYPYRMDIPTAEVALSALALLALSALAIRAARRRPYFLVGWLWYLGTLVPVIGIVRVGEQAMADRFTYLPLVGIFIAVVWGAADWAERRPRAGRALGVAAAATLVVFALVARAQIAHWHDSIALFGHALAVTRDNHAAEKNLGAALLAAGRVEEAIEHSRAAVRLRPRDPVAHTNLGAALARAGDIDAARAEYRRALEIDPQNAMAHLDLGVLLADRERWDDALHEYDEVLRIDPTYAKAHAGIGWVAMHRGQNEEAVARFRTALELDPRLAAASNSLALALEDLGRNDEALAVWEAALRRDPDESRLRFNYAAALVGSGRVREAEAQYREILARRPDSGEARAALADLLGRQAGASAATGGAASESRP